MTTVESYIKNNAQTMPSKVALVSAGEVVTYSQLYARIEDCSTKLLNDGVKEGDIIPLIASPSIDYLVKYFSVHHIGAVAVPLSEDIPSTFLEKLKAQIPNIEIPKGSADILYTTGTTGNSKGVIISHKAIIADAENLIAAQKFSPNHVFIICGPLNHAGCWSKVFPIMMLGGTLYITPGIKDINLFFEAMDYADSLIATFLVPASIRILLRFSRERLAAYADKIDFIETGAAPISKHDMEELCETLPNTRLYNTYASTETGIIATYDFNNNECIVGCLGKPMIHSSITISEDGTIICHGDTLMSGYVNEPDLTKEILKSDGIHTSDMGFWDSNGFLHLTGRKDDVINVGGYKVDPSEIEKVAMCINGMSDCICIPATHPIIGTVLKLNYILEGGKEIGKKEIAQFLSSKLESYKVPTYYESVNSINKTFNGKLDRKSYRMDK